MPRQADIDVQPYLRAIATTYAKWWQLYTLTDAQTKTQQESSPFNFGLMVQTVSKERHFNPDDPNRQDKAKIERFPVLEGIRKYVAEHRQVLLVGRPGSEKSTTLARLLLEEARGALPSGSQDFANDPSSNLLLGGARGGLVSGATDRPTPPFGHPSEEGIDHVTDFARIPVLVELRFWSGSLIDRIQAFFQRHGLQLDRTQIEDLLFHRRLLLLMDGLNELPSEDARRDVMKFRQDYPQVSMIFTTRDLSLGGDFGLERKLEMQPLTEVQMQAFVRSYLPEQAKVMLGQLKGRLREFGQTPLLLWMLCDLFRQTGKIPANLGEVFRAFTQGYEKNLKADVPVESDKRWWPELLQELAFWMMRGKPFGEPVPEVDVEFRAAIPKTEARQIFAAFLQRKEAQAEGAAQKYLDDLLRHHLIQPNGEQVEFRHQLLQEYYAAEYLLAHWEQISELEFKRDYLNYLKWTEALCLAVELSKEVALHLIKLSLSIDIMLSRKLVNSSVPETKNYAIKLFKEANIQENTKGFILRMINSSDEGFDFLENFNKTESTLTLESLINKIENSEYYARESAIRELTRSFSEEAIPILESCFHKETDEDVRSTIVSSLSEISGLGSIRLIEQALDDSSGLVRISAVRSVGKTRYSPLNTKLIEMLEDSNPCVCGAAVNSLVSIGENNSITIILDLISKLDNDYIHLDGFRKFWIDQKIVGIIYGSREAPHCTYQEIINRARNIGKKSALRSSLKELQFAIEKSSETWISSVEALALIGGKNAQNVLLDFLKDEETDPNLLMTVVQIVERIRLDCAIPLLRQKIFSSRINDSINDVIVDALATLNDYCVLPRLTQLWDFSGGMRFYSAISRLQKNCKFYNYDLTQTTQLMKLDPKPEQPLIDPPLNVTKIYDLRGATIGNWAENQHGTQQTTQIQPNSSQASESPQ